MKVLIQTQLSSYNPQGKFDLATDSGWQMVMGRVRVMLRQDEKIEVAIMCPHFDDCIAWPLDVNADLVSEFRYRMTFLQHSIIPNALATRFDFDYREIKKLVGDKKFDVVYVNDPMHLRNLKAVFNELKQRPLYVTHSHFIDNPSCPKFPVEASLWMGQVEAARRSDVNFWQCESAMDIFFDEMSKEYRDYVVGDVRTKSQPWDDGYSVEEISSKVNLKNVRFDVDQFFKSTRGTSKSILFVPNRIGDGKRSSDYTNCGKFMREVVPELRKLRDDFVVVCGNPNQKISNEELEATSGPHGYVNVLRGVEGSGSFNRDEYKWIAQNSDIVVSLYNQDSYGGTASRECIELGCLPFWLDNYEYATISRLAGWSERFVADPRIVVDDMVKKLSDLIDHVQSNVSSAYIDQKKLKNVVRARCSYEETTQKALTIIRAYDRKLKGLQ